MVLHIVEQVQELVVVGSMARLPGQLIHIWGPPGSFDGRHGHRIDFTWTVLPLLRRSVHDVALTKGTNLGSNSLLLLQEHAAGLKVSNLGHHGALHYGAALVVFDVAHPPWFLQGDLFRESLLLEVADGVIISISEKMLDG